MNASLRHAATRRGTVASCGTMQHGRGGRLALTARRSIVTLLIALSAGGCAHRLPDATTAPANPTATGGPAEQPGTGAATPAVPGNWEGRLSLKLHARGNEAARGVALAFALQGTPLQGRLDLSTPLGTQVAAVSWREDQALLETADGRRPYTSLDLLTQEVLGEALPVQAMMSWLQGRPDPALPWHPYGSSAADTAAPPQAAPATRFEQAGWTVDLTRLGDGQIEAGRPSSDAQRGADLKVRLMR